MAPAAVLEHSLRHTNRCYGNIMYRCRCEDSSRFMFQMDGHPTQHASRNNRTSWVEVSIESEVTGGWHPVPPDARRSKGGELNLPRGSLDVRLTAGHPSSTAASRNSIDSSVAIQRGAGKLAGVRHVGFLLRDGYNPKSLVTKCFKKWQTWLRIAKTWQHMNHLTMTHEV